MAGLRALMAAGGFALVLAAALAWPAAAAGDASQLRFTATQAVEADRVLITLQRHCVDGDVPDQLVRFSVVTQGRLRAEPPPSGRFPAGRCPYPEPQRGTLVIPFERTGRATGREHLTLTVLPGPAHGRDASDTLQVDIPVPAAGPAPTGGLLAAAGGFVGKAAQLLGRWGHLGRRGGRLRLEPAPSSGGGPLRPTEGQRRSPGMGGAAVGRGG